jgi:radical SAM superfamily enzyme YgiQ (UPF0313 family)
VKVLLISENQARDNMVPYPLGVAYVASAVKAAGHQVAGLDLMFSDDPGADTARAVADFGPDVVGVAIRNIDSQQMYDNKFYLPQVVPVVESIKAAADVPIVLGGAGFSIFPLECLEYLGLELGVVGEAERAFPALLDRLQEGREPTGLPGVAARRRGGGSVNWELAYPDFPALPAPDREVFGVSSYNWSPGEGRKGPPFVTNAQFGRGCHLHCIYCSSPLVEGRVARRREPGEVAGELAELAARHGTSFVAFVDSLFNCPAELTIRLCREIEARQTGIRWACSVNPMFFHPELYQAMADAGCLGISIGNESGSRDMLSALRKEFSKEDILRSFRGARDAGLNVFCFLLLGGPGETRETVEESIAFMDELGPKEVNVTTGIRIFPRCEMERIAVAEGVISPGQNLLHPTFYMAREVEPWLRGFMQEACAARPGWFT